jgi:hypothetical protein
LIRRGTVRADGTSTVVPKGVYDMAELDTELDPALEAQAQALLSKLDPRETAAQFRLEVFFRAGPRRSVPVRGIVTFFTNGGYLNGGGDSNVHLCPQELERGPCLEPIDVQVMPGKMALCTRCRRVTPKRELIGEAIFDVPMQRWAAILVRLFGALHGNADLAVCLERESIHKAKELELTTHAEGAAYARVNQGRQWITYALADIIKDTSSGKGLETAFRAFLEA